MTKEFTITTMSAHQKTIGRTLLSSKTRQLGDDNFAYCCIIEKGEDGYLISEVVELPGCHTQAKTMDELLKRTQTLMEGFRQDENVKNG